ncbi:hypothetical protein HYR69_08375, partial [Candidatus Sumerlaeota bacterium]|nr:hypothetical protein [Candidatus Sumerlaeota bacterium]
MRFGKREQIVVLGLAVLGTIGLLHLLFFSGRASELATSFKKVQELEGQVRDLKRIADMGRFNKFKEMTKALGTTYTDVITSLSLTHPPEFNALRLDDVVITPPKGAAKEQIQKMKEAKLNEMRKEQSGKQLDLIYAQLEKLQEFAADAERNDETKTKAYFLGNFSGKGGGWNLPIALPKDLYSPNNKSDIGKLVDKLRELSQNKGMLDVINKEQTELQKKQRDIY